MRPSTDNDPASRIAVCLCSGGLDSTIAASIAQREEYEVHLFHVNYGQKAERKERETVMNIADALKAEEVRFANIDLFKGLCALTTEKSAIPIRKDVRLDASCTPVTWVQCRNLVFSGMAAAYAEYLEAERIYVGFNAEEAMSYPDNRPEFVDKFNELMPHAIASFSRAPLIAAPLVNLRKPDIVRLGQSISAPMHLSWSCYQEGEAHCGICESCQHRRRGFLEAGVADPTRYMQ